MATDTEIEPAVLNFVPDLFLVDVADQHLLPFNREQVDEGIGDIPRSMGNRRPRCRPRGPQGGVV
jgi:hypothetical protein